MSELGGQEKVDGSSSPGAVHVMGDYSFLNLAYVMPSCQYDCLRAMMLDLAFQGGALNVAPLAEVAYLGASSLPHDRVETEASDLSGRVMWET